MAPPYAGESTAELKDLVQRHQVCWEVYPLAIALPGGGLRRIGFEIELFGTYVNPEGPITPGSDECHEVYDALAAIADAVVPRDAPETRHEIEPAEVALRFSPKRKFRKDVRLAIQLVHSKDYSLPIDAPETRSLAELTESLKRLGVRKEHW